MKYVSPAETQTPQNEKKIVADTSKTTVTNFFNSEAFVSVFARNELTEAEALC